jgi:hypothetical protein
VYKYLLSIPGFGPDLSAKVLAAIGDLFRFESLSRRLDGRESSFKDSRLGLKRMAADISNHELDAESEEQVFMKAIATEEEGKIHWMNSDIDMKDIREV